MHKCYCTEMNTPAPEVEVCVGDTIQNLNETIRLYHITITYKDDNKMDKTIFSLTTDFNILQTNHKKTTKKLNVKLEFGIFFSNCTTNEENCEKRANEIKNYVTEIVSKTNDSENILVQLGFSKKDNMIDYYELSKRFENNYFKLFYFNKAIKKGNKEIVLKFLENPEFEDFVANSLGENYIDLASQNVEFVKIFTENPKLFSKLDVIIYLLFYQSLY